MERSRHAILIGCNDYDHFPKLRCSANDVSEMESTLKDKDIGEFTNVLSFSKGESNSEILSKMEEIITGTAERNDTILIYFSGHGWVDHDNLYLALKNTNMKSLDNTSIAIDRIIKYVDKSKCKATLIILDCCYSGAVKGSFPLLREARGLHIITSSTLWQQSNEKEGEKNSFFTKFLLEGLQSGDADLYNDGVITVDEVFSYINNKCEKGYGLQNPVKFYYDVRGDLIMAKNKYYVPLDPSRLSGGQLSKFIAVEQMIKMLKSENPPLFFVALWRYYIEDEPYKASGLTVSPGHTPNIRQLQTGFECDAFFPPEMLTDHVKSGKEVINGVVGVRMKVNLEDIWLIGGKEKGGKGGQFNLGQWIGPVEANV